MKPQDLFPQHGESVKQLLCSLLGGEPSPRVLANITGLPEQNWLEDYPYGGEFPQALSRTVSLRACLAGTPGALSLFAKLQAEGDFFFTSLHLAALGQELEAVETLFRLAIRIQSSVGPASVNVLTLLAMRSLLGLHVDQSEDFVPRYLELCRQLFPLMVACGCQIPSPALIFFRARGLARLAGKPRLAAFFELLIGATNMCNHNGHGNARYHQIMRHGMEKLHSMADPEDLLEASPYFGICYFLEGRYQQAMREFQMASLLMRRDGLTMMELFCLRHWCFSAFTLGQFEFSEHQLLSRLRQFSPRSDNQLARTIRGQLASCFLRTGQLDSALEHLDTAQFDVSPRHDIVSWITNSRQLAYYHILSGNVSSAYQVFRSALEDAQAQCYERPLYLSCVLLEILYVFHQQAYPPLPCYDLEKELERCLHGPNRILKGISCRILGDLCQERGQGEDARAFYEQSLELLSDVSVLEQSKTHVRLAAFHLQRDRAKAVFHALYAWPQHDHLLYFWSPELEELVPPHIREKEKGVSQESILAQYRESLAAIPASSDDTTFALNLLMSSCHILGATYGFLFAPENAGEGLRLVASVGPEGPYERDLHATNFRDFLRIVQDGAPQIFDKMLDPARPQEGGRMVVGIPLEGGPAGSYILCHDHLNDPDIRYVLNTELLEEIAQLAGKILNKNLGLGEVRPVLPRRRKASASEHTEIISASSAMKAVLDQVDVVADTDASILIVGESGVGKDLVARRLHERSGRPGNMVSLNMAGLSDELLANELFGHEKGAFTGAHVQKPGLIELARKGTLFLDEITEASPGVQASLLRILENRQFYRVGGTQPLSADFRLISASNRDMKTAVAEGRFRRDLYYRISSVILQVPLLRERPEDITALAFYYLHYFANRHGRDCVPKISPENMRALLDHSWPGNVRELKNVMEQSVLFSSGREIRLNKVSAAPNEATLPPASPAQASDKVHPFSLVSDFPSLESMEERYIRMVLDLTGGRINGASGALDILKMNRSTLYSRLKKYGLRG